MGTRGDGERAAGLLVTASLNLGPSQSESIDVPFTSTSSIRMSICLSTPAP